MGQKCCCRPSTQRDPKNIHLLNLIYTQTQQNVRNLDNNQLKQYLAKKGYIKTLCDYLSSHLNQIYQSISYCKSKIVLAKSKTAVAQLLVGCITTEILQKIVALYLELKLKSNRREKTTTSILDEKPPSQLKIIEALSKKGHRKTLIAEVAEDPIKLRVPSGHSKNLSIEFGVIKDQINYIILETCNQLMRETMSPRRIQKIEKNGFIYEASKQKSVEQSSFAILMSLQNILLKILEQEENFLKVNYTLIKDILSNLIDNLILCQKSIEIIGRKQNAVTGSEVQLQSAPNTLRTFLKAQRENNQSQLSKQPKLQTECQWLAILQQYEGRILEMRKLCLQNYYKLIKKANLHLANASFYKMIVKVHLPILLENWADLMIQKDELGLKLSHLSSRKYGQELEPDQEAEIAEKEKNIKVAENIIQSIILEFFSCYFSYRESQYIYRELMRIFDRLNFSRQKIGLIQKLVFHAIRNYDLKESVISNWFDYLLNYLGCIITISMTNPNLSDSFYTDRRNDSLANAFEEPNYLSDLNDQVNLLNESHDYVNWFKEENVVGCLKTVTQWINLKHVNIEDILTFKQTKLLVIGLSNLAWGSTKITEEIYKLIAILIKNDVRYFGHLVSTAIYFMKKLKISNNIAVPNQQNWAFFLQSWSKPASSTQQAITLKQNYLRPRGSSPSSRPHKKSSFQGVQLIPVESLIENIICIASHPFLSEIVAKGTNGDNGQEPIRMKRHNSTNIQINEVDIELRKSESYKALQQEAKEVEMEGNAIKTAPSNYGNLGLCASVFQETLEILLQQFQLSPKPVQAYRIKLSGLVIASNLINMGTLMDGLAKEKVYNFSFSLATKINKFLAWIYRLIGKLDSQSKGRLSNDQQSQYQESQAGNEQTRKDTPNNKGWQMLKAKSLLLRSINLWIYPALSHILKQSDEPENSKQQPDQDKSKKGEKYKIVSQIRILLRACVKLYFKNLVEASLKKTEMQSKISIEEATQDKQEENGNRQNRNDRNKIRKSQSKSAPSLTLIGQCQYLQRLFGPIVEIYQLFTEFYQKYRNRQGKMLEQQQAISVRVNQTQKTSLCKQNKFKSEIIGYKDTREVVEQINEEKLQKSEILQLGQKIKVNLNTYRNHMSQYKSQSQEFKRKSFLQEIPCGSQIMKTPYQQNLELNRTSAQSIILQAAKIIRNQNLCRILYFLVNNHQVLLEDEANSSSQRVIQSYFLKKQVYKNGKKIEDQFLRKQENEVGENQACMKERSRETINTEQPLNSKQMKDQFLYILPQLIDNFQSKYSEIVLSASSQAFDMGRSPTKIEYFNLEENKMKKEPSVIDSSNIGSATLEDNSFKQVIGDIRNH